MDKKMKTILVIALIVLSGFVFADSIQQNQNSENSVAHSKADTSTNKKKSDANQQLNKGLPVTIEIVRAPTIRIEATEKPATAPSYPSTEWWTIWFTGILAVTTIALAVFTYFLWASTNTLVRGAESTAMRQLRAYLFTNISILRPFNHGSGLQITVVVKNAGQTPAHQVECSGRIALGADNMKLFPEPIKEEGDFVVHPHSDSVSSFTIDYPAIPQADQADISNGIKAMYAYGVIKYVDVFKLDQYTNFKFKLQKNPNSGEFNLWAYCIDGNEAS